MRNGILFQKNAAWLGIQFSEENSDWEEIELSLLDIQRFSPLIHMESPLPNLHEIKTLISSFRKTGIDRLLSDFSDAAGGLGVNTDALRLWPGALTESEPPELKPWGRYWLYLVGFIWIEDLIASLRGSPCIREWPGL